MSDLKTTLPYTKQTVVSSGKSHDVIACYDNILNENPNYHLSFINNKEYTFNKFKEFNEPIKCCDIFLLTPNNGYSLLQVMQPCYAI